MSKTRYVNTKFWDDSYIAELDAIDKLFFIYLLTNSAVELCGIYELPIKKMSFETGIPSDRLSIGFDRLSRDGKVYYIDGWVIIKNFLRHQSTNPKMLKGAERCFNEIPLRIWEKIVQIEDLRIAYDSLSKAFALNLTILNSTLLNLSVLSGGAVAPTQKVETQEKEIEEINPVTGIEIAENISSPTPAQEAREFFEDEEKQKACIDMLVARGAPEDIAKNELRKFVSHWTEPTPTGKRQRWQTEKAFEVKRRLATWLNNSAKWSNKTPQFASRSGSITNDPNL